MLKEAWHEKFLRRVYDNFDISRPRLPIIVAGLNLSTVTDKEIDLAVAFLLEQK